MGVVTRGQLNWVGSPSWMITQVGLLIVIILGLIAIDAIWPRQAEQAEQAAHTIERAVELCLPYAKHGEPSVNISSELYGAQRNHPEAHEGFACWLMEPPPPESICPDGAEGDVPPGTMGPMVLYGDLHGVRYWCDWDGLCKASEIGPLGTWEVP